MKVFRSLDEIVPDAQGSAVTIGKFDGVHTGHLAIVQKLTAAAKDRGLETTVFTFDENPLQLFAPEKCPTPLTSPAQRLRELERIGVATAVMVPFTQELAALSAEDFVQGILVNRLNARYITVGSDFRFGRGGKGDVELLTQLGNEHGFEVEVISDVIGDGGDRVSSTMIRNALTIGDVTHATELLGRLPRVSGTVVRGDARGCEIGFPTANIDSDIEGLVPADGVYAGWLTHKDSRYLSSISIGTNPTFEGERARRVEAYVLDETLDLYGQTVHVDFVEQLRPTLKFSSADELIQQMHRDVEQTRQVLRNSE
jgi:riboflavin kinase/FMN adenylyltransferase